MNLAVADSPAKCSLLPPVGERAVVVLPPEDMAQRLDQLRRKYDPEWFRRVPPHVSLAGPMKSAFPDQKTAGLIEEAVEGIGRFSVTLLKPGVFVVPELILYLAIEDDLPLLALHERLRKALFHVPRFAFVPHVTLGHFASQADLEPAYREAARLTEEGGLTFEVEEVHLFGEDSDTTGGVYRSISRVGLESRSAF